MEISGKSNTPYYKGHMFISHCGWKWKGYGDMQGGQRYVPVHWKMLLHQFPFCLGQIPVENTKYMTNELCDFRGRRQFSLLFFIFRYVSIWALKLWRLLEKDLLPNVLKISSSQRNSQGLYLLLNSYYCISWKILLPGHNRKEGLKG